MMHPVLLCRIVCSDVMARGMDIEDVRTVINYDVPVYIKTYIHRVGRTARAGREGAAYTLLQSKEVCIAHGGGRWWGSVGRKRHW